MTGSRRGRKIQGGCLPRPGVLMSDVTVWIAIFMFGLVGLNWPVLEVFHGHAFWYLLLFWLLFVLLVHRAARGGLRPPGN